jgi:prephenate dehydrogenase
MFRNARWLLCPTKATKTSAVRAVERVLAAMGATPVRIAPDDHDRQVAILSHLPHVFAATLVLLAEGLERTDISGGSWKDLTRVGGVDPQLWTQILSCNRAELVSTVAEAEDLLRQFRVALEGGDVDTIHDLLSRARAAKARQERA